MFDRPPARSHGNEDASRTLQDHVHDLRQQPARDGSGHGGQSHSSFRDANVRIGISAGMSQGHSQMTREGNGSGVIVGKKGCDIYIATDNHVVNPESPAPGVKVKVKDRSVTMPDGRKYHADVVKVDRRHDLAFIKVHMSEDDAQKYQAASLSDETPHSGKGEVDGFPDGTKKLRSNSVEFKGERPVKDIMHEQRAPLLPGEDPNRNLIWMKGKTSEGQSGGGVFDSSKRVVGLEEGGRPDGSYSYANPLTRQSVRRYLPNIELQ